MGTQGPAGIRPTPLTKHNNEGGLYTRTPEVESQIESAFFLDPASLLVRARVVDRKSPDYLQEECLVYFIREYLRKDDERTVESLFEILYGRCVTYIKIHLCALSPEDVEDAFQEVLEEVTDKILDLDSDRGDFYQVRLWRALKMKMITVYNEIIEDIKKRENDISIDRSIETEEDDDLDVFLCDGALSSEDIAFIKEGVIAIPDRHRKMFLLLHYEGWPIKSKDPETMTLSKYFDVDPKTIYNWLNEVGEALRMWREGKEK